MTIGRAHFSTAFRRKILVGRGIRRGYILVMLSLSLTFLLGVTGMAIDLGRMYIAKSEAQHFADSASIAAALQLDGITGDTTAAKNAVANTPMRWGFGQTAFTASNLTTTFATSSTGTFTATPPNPPTNYNYAQVVVQVSVPMTLMRILVGSTAQVAASAIAGWQPTTTLPGGEFPFAPYTRAGYAGAAPDNAGDPYGMTIGGEYTLRWGSPGDRTECANDVGKPTLASNGKIRGYCCVAESAATLRESIVGGDTDPVAVGSPVPMDNGAKDTEMTAIADRVDEDTDLTSTTYAQYVANGAGNGERVVMVPINGGPPNYTNMGFAAFFLEVPGNYTKLGGNDSACALYIGQYRQGQTTLTATGSGAAHVKLF